MLEEMKEKTALIVFIEGADGVGKTTFTSGLIRQLALADKKVAATHIIKHTNSGNSFYNEWTKGKHNDLTAAACMLGVTASTIREMNESKYYHEIIIVDRSQASFYAFQLNKPNIRELFLPVFEQSLEADFYKDSNFMTIYLHCDPVIAQERMLASRGTLDYIESRGVEFQETVRQTYNECFTKYEILAPSLIIDTGVVDSERAVNSGFIEIVKRL